MLQVPPDTVIVLGAGATKACGGPLTAEILPAALSMPALDWIDTRRKLVETFLVDRFHLPAAASVRQVSDYPPLPLLMSLIDLAIDQRSSFGAEWPAAKLVDLRRALEACIFGVIYEQLEASKDLHGDLVNALLAANPAPRLISLNYDLLIDNALLTNCMGRNPDYGCRVSNHGYRIDSSSPLLLKLHGSFNWLYCPNCQRLRLARAKGGFVKVEAVFLDAREQFEKADHPLTCPINDEGCDAALIPVMISPSSMKDYRNPHIAAIWHMAAQALRVAKRVVFIGYSLPDDDLHVVYLLKRTLSRSPPPQIDVVSNSPMQGNQMYERYRTLFGTGITWHADGFEGWLRSST